MKKLNALIILGLHICVLGDGSSFVFVCLSVQWRNREIVDIGRSYIVKTIGGSHTLT